MDVTLNVTMTSNYCGGAPPPEEMLEKLNTPKKFTNQSFFVSTQKSLMDNLIEMKTTSAGTLDISLEMGTYYVFLPQKISAKLSGNDKSEAECEKWKNTPNGSFNVSNENSVSFNIHKTCDDCSPMRM